MKKVNFLLTSLLAFSLIAVAGCNSGGGKKKKSSSGGGGGGDVTDLAWEGGFSGAVTIGASTSVVEGAEGQVNPTTAKTSFATLANKRTFGDPDTGVIYDFTFKFEFSAKVKTDAKDYNDYIESQVTEGDKTLVNFKGWPSQLVDKKEWPRFYVKAIGTCNSQTKEKTYTLVLNPQDKVFKDMSLAEIYSKHADGNKLIWMGPKLDQTKKPIDDAYTTDLDQVPGQSSYWVRTKGYITYASLDNNWGLLQNGEHTIQLYQLGEYDPFKTSRDTYMNKPVVVEAQISEGYGNVQLSYVNKIAVIEGTDDTVKQPDKAVAFTEAMMGNHDWVNQPMFNKIVEKTAVTFVGSVRKANNGEKPTDITDTSNISLVKTSSGKEVAVNDRYEFDAKIGEAEFVVGYDYHAAGDDVEMAKEFEKVLKSAPGSTVYIGGTVRWQNDRKTVKESGEVYNDYSVRVKGLWTIAPFMTSQVSVSA